MNLGRSGPTPGGVSRSTVSRVVNEDRRVSDAVRARVLAIVQEHDYHPNAAGRTLATRRTHILGLLIPQAAREIFSDPFFPLLMQGDRRLQRRRPEPDDAHDSGPEAAAASTAA